MLEAVSVNVSLQSALLLCTARGIPPRAPGRSYGSIKKGAAFGAGVCWAVHPTYGSVAKSGVGGGNIPLMYGGKYIRKEKRIRGSRSRRGAGSKSRRVNRRACKRAPRRSLRAKPPPTRETSRETDYDAPRSPRGGIVRSSRGPGLHFGERQAYYLGSRPVPSSSTVERLLEWHGSPVGGRGGRVDRATGLRVRGSRPRARRGFDTATRRWVRLNEPGFKDPDDDSERF